MERIRQLTSHLAGSSKGLAALEEKRPDDVVITLAVRSPLTKAKKGALKDTRLVFFILNFGLPAHGRQFFRSDELLTSMYKVRLFFGFSYESTQFIDTPDLIGYHR